MPGSFVHGIFQAEIILEWVAISSSRGSSWPGVDPASPAFAGGFFTTAPSRALIHTCCVNWLNSEIEGNTGSTVFWEEMGGWAIQDTMWAVTGCGMQIRTLLLLRRYSQNACRSENWDQSAGGLFVEELPEDSGSEWNVLPGWAHPALCRPEASSPEGSTCCSHSMCLFLLTILWNSLVTC